MGIQATMNIGDKANAAAVSVVGGTATYPSANEVSIAVILSPLEFHRLSEVIRSIRICYDYARDNDLFNSAVDICVVTNLDNQKGALRTELLSASMLTGDLGILIVGSERVKGGTNILENAHKQLLDWMNENDRLIA